MIKAIIFDWHGVLDMGSFMQALQDVSERTGKNFRELYEGLTEEKEACWRGELPPEGFFVCIQRALGITDEERDSIHAAYMPIVPNEALWALLPSLKQQYTLGILSNAPSDKVAAIRKTMDLSFFDAVFFSCEKGKSKLDPTFFLDVAQALGEAPKDCLYVDDQLRYVETAERLGFQGCVFTQIDDLAICLQKP